jgi:glycosyltransferase involved in cell wall biosynthesis
MVPPQEYFAILDATIMRILLVGNYALDHQASMLRYAEMLRLQMTLRGHQVELIQPRTILGDLAAQPFLRKWLGYIDKYVFFPIELRSRAKGFDLVHVCDHSNSMYLAHVGDRPASITCHDLLAIKAARGHYSGQKRSLTGKMQQRWILKHLAGARDVVCDSANTACELAVLSGGAAQRVMVIPIPLSSNCSPATDESILHMRKGLGLAADERYLIHVGGDKWYKNRPGLLRIFGLLLERLDGGSAPPLRLVMVGRPFTKMPRDTVALNLPEGSVIEVVSPSDEELWVLYSGATALLFPSLHEGFGWPLIEAQRCGCPVITSNRPPMTEVAGPAALYIDPEDETAAAARIAADLDQLALLREAGLRNAKRFDPAAIIPAYEEFFAGVVQARGRIDDSLANSASQTKPQ